MAISFKSGSVAASPNVTPLIDVLLVLLIIFMVIAPTRPLGLSSQIPRPPSAADLTADVHAPVVLQIHAPLQPGGAVRYEWKERSADAAGLLTELLTAKAASTQRVLWVQGDANVDYRAVVTAVQAAHGAGFDQIGLLPRERQ